MKRFVVCGDSFSAVSNVLPGTHWSELLAKKLDWKLLNYARRGCSNGGIRLQIEEAIKQKVDFVFIVPTGWDRIELPVSDNFYLDKSTAPKSYGNILQDFLLDQSKSCYDETKTISNINYDPSAQHDMIFETIFSLAENYDHEYRKSKLTNEKQNAMKTFINHIYDSGWKQQQDKWIIANGAFKLWGNNIPFSIENGMLWENKNDLKNEIDKIIPDHYIRNGGELIGTGTYLYPLNDKEKDPGYHSEPEGQEWIANLYSNIIKKEYKL